MLAFGAVAAASATMPFAPRAEDASVKRTQVLLPKFHVAADQIIGARVGLRPFRPSGFVVKSEPFRDKTLIPFPTAYVVLTKTLIAETNALLPALIADVRDHGGTIEMRGFADKAELQALDAPLIVNASGLGAKALFGDSELVPVKGQITLLKPHSEIHYGYVDPVLDLYMFPRSDAIVLGGSHGHDDWSLEPDPERATQIP
jgi:hypothetical protein